MPFPLPFDISTMTKRITNLFSEATSATKTSETLKTKTIPQNHQTEGVNLKYFNHFHTSCITQYEIEMTWITGNYIINPLVEQDVIDRANFTGRLYDTTGAEPDIIEIPELTGGGTTQKISTPATGPLWEYSAASVERYYMRKLKTGLNPITSYNTTITGDVTISGGVDSEFTVYVDSITGVNINDEVLCSGGGYSCIALVTFAGTGGGSCTPSCVPNTQIQCTVTGGIWTIGYAINIKLITAPNGAIPIGGNIRGSWSGFSNSDRTNETASDPNLQDLMDFCITDLERAINNHITYITNEIACLNLNKHSALDPTAKTNCQTAKTNYTNYVNALDISDTGLTTLANLNTTRDDIVAARVSAIHDVLDSDLYAKRKLWLLERSGRDGTMVKSTQFQKAADTSDTRAVETSARANQLKGDIFDTPS